RSPCGIPLNSVLEWVVHQNRVLALRTGRQQCDRTADQLLDPADILDRLRRQFRPGASARGPGLPALDGFVDRLDPGLGVLAGRKIVDFAPVEAVSHTDLELRQAIENVELGEGQAIDSAGTNGLAHQHRVEPAAAPGPTGHGAELAPALAQQAAEIV